MAQQLPSIGMYTIYLLVFMELCPESLLESASNLVFELLLVVLLLLSLVGVAEEDVEELDAVRKKGKKIKFIGVAIDPALQ